MKRSKRILSTREMATIAVLGAISAVLYPLEIPIVLFYKLDVSNLPVLLGTFAMGTLPGTIILLIKSALGLLHSSSQGVGELADFLMGFAMLLPAGLLYQFGKSKKSAIWGMAAGTVLATIVSVLVNLYIMIPFYSVVFHMPVEKIISMGQSVVPAIKSSWSFVMMITAPFNLVKWVLISVLTALIYKPLSPILHSYKKPKGK